MKKLPPFVLYILAWFGLPFIAVFNGMLREFTYCYMIGDYHAHQVSAVLLSIFICFYVAVLNSRVALPNAKEALGAGLIWLVLTIAFEFLLGFARGMSWHEQIEAYDAVHGNLWVLVPATVLLAPVLLRHQKLVHLPG